MRPRETKTRVRTMKKTASKKDAAIPVVAAFTGTADPNTIPTGKIPKTTEAKATNKAPVTPPTKL